MCWPKRDRPVCTRSQGLACSLEYAQGARASRHLLLTEIPKSGQGRTTPGTLVLTSNMVKPDMLLPEADTLEEAGAVAAWNDGTGACL